MSDFIETNMNDDGIVEIENSGSQKRRKFMSHSVNTQHLSGRTALLAFAILMDRCTRPGALLRRRPTSAP